MSATLFVIPGSHPAMAARKMLEAKGIAYKRRDLIPVVSKAVVRAAGFPGTTVPALKLGGKKIQGTGEIARHLDSVRPTPRLVPEDPALRTKVEAAEEFGDSALQGVARRITWNALRRDKSPLRSYSEGAKLGVPVGLAVATAAPIIVMAARMNDAGDENVRNDLAALPEMIDTIDGWIADGVVGGAEPNVADYQLAGSLALLMSIDDVRPLIEGRPAAGIAERIAPDFPGRTPAILPAEWLAPLRAAA
jgi:glutathione S-transferase